MTTKVEISSQVEHFVKALAPEPRRTVRSALRRLVGGKGDVKALEGELADFSRLRVGSYRIIFHTESGSEGRVIRCDFAEKRAIVYEVFAEIIKQQLVEAATERPSVRRKRVKR